MCTKNLQNIINTINHHKISVLSLTTVLKHFFPNEPLPKVLPSKLKMWLVSQNMQWINSWMIVPCAVSRVRRDEWRITLGSWLMMRSLRTGGRTLMMKALWEKHQGMNHTSQCENRKHTSWSSRRNSYCWSTWASWLHVNIMSRYPAI